MQEAKDEEARVPRGKRLKRVNFLDYDKGKGRREGRVMQRYHIVESDDYNKYH